MDPELQGPDPLCKFLLSGKAHVFYSLVGIIVLAIAVDAGAPRWLDAIVAVLAGGIFADAWAHQFLH
jgi:hypothetical protein